MQTEVLLSKCSDPGVKGFPLVTAFRAGRPCEIYTLANFMKNTRKELIFTYCSAGAMALLASVVYLRVSQATGRLHQDLMYDDIKYVNDAVSRLSVGYEQGVLAFLSTFATNPPHSPFSALLACGALIVGGFQDSAVYIANSILLIAAAVFLVWRFQHARKGTIFWIVTAFLCSPFAYRTIHDFRPDIVLGFMTAVMVYFFALGLTQNSSKYFKLAGIVFGCCLLIKPTFFAHTFALAIALVGLHQAMGCKWATNVLPRMAIPRRHESVRFMLIGVFLPLPYFAVNATHIFSYFWSFTHGDKSSIWSFPATTSLFIVAKAYLLETSAIADHGLGGSHTIIMSLSIVASLVLALYRRNIKDLCFSLTMLYATLVSFLIIVVGRHNNGFFMASFYSLLFMNGFFSFAYLARNVGCNGARLLLIFAWLLLILAMYTNRTIVHWQPSSEASVLNSWNSKVVTAIADDMSSHEFTPSEKIRLFVSMAGPVNEQTIKWTATKRGVNIHPLVQRIFLSDTIGDFSSAANESHYILVPNEVNSEYYKWLPSGKVQATFLNLLRNDARFRQVHFFSEEDHYYLFANREVYSQTIQIE